MIAERGVTEHGVTERGAGPERYLLRRLTHDWRVGAWEVDNFDEISAELCDFFSNCQNLVDYYIITYNYI